MFVDFEHCIEVDSLLECLEVWLIAELLVSLLQICFYFSSWKYLRVRFNKYVVYIVKW